MHFPPSTALLSALSVLTMTMATPLVTPLENRQNNIGPIGGFSCPQTIAPGQSFDIQFTRQQGIPQSGFNEVALTVGLGGHVDAVGCSPNYILGTQRISSQTTNPGELRFNFQVPPAQDVCLPQGGQSLLSAVLFEGVGEYFQPMGIIWNATVNVGTAVSGSQTSGPGYAAF